MHTKKKLPPGLVWRGETIHINTNVCNEDIRGTTGTDQVKKAQVFLEKKKVEVRERQEQIKKMKHSNLTVPPEMLAKTYGDAVKLFFKETKHKNQQAEKSQVEAMSWCLPLDTPLNEINHSTIKPFIDQRKKWGQAAKTINHFISLVTNILNTAIKTEVKGVPWRNRQDNFKKEKVKGNINPDMDKRDGYILSWDEQDNLLNALPEHLRDAALYSVNTGARTCEITELRWSWEIIFDEPLKIKAFRIPGIVYENINGKRERKQFHKNGKPKLVVLNSIAREIIERQRGKHQEFVFTYKRGEKLAPQPIKSLNNSSFQRIRKLMNMEHVIFHDFRSTFSNRLTQGYGVSKDTCSILMGHTIPGVTADYAFSTDNAEPLVAAVDKLVERKHFTYVPAYEDLNHTKITQSFNYASDAKQEVS
jgi:integrase